MKAKMDIADQWFLPIRHKVTRTTVVPMLGRLAVAGLFAAGFTLLSWPADAAAQSTPPGKEWHVKYILWQGLPKTVQKKQLEKTVEVSLGPESIAGKSRKDVQFLIPVAQVIEVTYDTEIHHRGGGWAGAAGEMAEDPDSPEELLGAVPLMLVAAILSPMHSTKHFVHIAWRDQGKVRDVTLEAAKEDYTPFLQELGTVTGKEWKNLPAEREKLRQEIEQESDRSMPVRLDHKIWLAETNLKAGPYQLVLLQREENRGELYFFAGTKVNSRQVAGLMIVQIETLSTGVAGAQVAYKDEQGVTMISEIRTPDKILRPAAQALP